MPRSDRFDHCERFPDAGRAGTLVATMPPPHLGPGTALWVDAAGTLLHPARPIAEVYAELAARHGHAVALGDVAARLRPAMKRHAPLRVGERTWSRYWRAVVGETLGTEAPFEELYAHYARGDAWRIAPDAERSLEVLRARGVRTALISNWDDRLRHTLDDLRLLERFDAVLISAEEGVEKPDPEIFRRAAARLSVPAEKSLMVGDTPDSDIAGALAVGASALQFGKEIKSFASIMEW